MVQAPGTLQGMARVRRVTSIALVPSPLRVERSVTGQWYHNLGEKQRNGTLKKPGISVGVGHTHAERRMGHIEGLLPCEASSFLFGVAWRIMRNST